MPNGLTDRERPSRAARARMPRTDEDCRCDCGSLLARLVAEAVEVKCRRCKRVVRIHLPAVARASDQTLRDGEPLRVTTVASSG